MTPTKDDVRADLFDPRVLKRLLCASGELVGVRLALQHVDELLFPAAISTRFSIPPTTLRRWHQKGLVIAYTPAGASRVLMPVAQFRLKGVASWAKDIVQHLGNGLPAVNFLMVGRIPLRGASYSELILRGDPSAQKRMEQSIRRIVAE